MKEKNLQAYNMVIGIFTWMALSVDSSAQQTHACAVVSSYKVQDQA